MKRNRWSPRWQGHFVETQLVIVTIKGEKEDVPAIIISFPEWENRKPIIIRNKEGVGMKKLRNGGWDNIPHTEIKKEDIRCYHYHFPRTIG